MRHERRSNIGLLVALIVLMVALIAFAPFYGWRLRQWFAPSNLVLQGNGQGDDLATENQALKAQLAELQDIQSEMPTSSTAYVRAMVYSRYPFNFKNELLVDAGADQGVASGSAVVYKGMLIGRVKDVWARYASVQTVFDIGFRMAVRIGPSGFDGLLTGGSYPYVASVAKTAAVQPNMIVYSAVSGVPYALPVGEVQSTSTSPDSLFTQATLMFPYDINQVETVLIAKQ